jgi:general secretion pathway protein D
MNSRDLRLLVAAIALGVAACAADPLKEAHEQFQQGRGEEALALLDRAAKEDPQNHALRSEYFRLRDVLAAQWLAQAETLRLGGQFETAEALYRRVQQYDAANARARGGLAQIEVDKRHREILAGVERLLAEEKYREAREALQPLLAENPQHRDGRRLRRQLDEKLARPATGGMRLKYASEKPISIEMRDVTLRALFDVLQTASSVNFVFDKDVRGDQRTSITLREAPFDEAIRLVLMSNQLEHKIVSANTILVFPNTPQKLREYQELVVKSFYLANADVKQTANMIRALVKTRDLYIDEKLNMLVIKDTPNAVRLAERLIAAQDLAEPEVMLEVEVLEVGSNRLMELGMRYPDSVAWSLVGRDAATAATPGVVSLPDWITRDAGLVRLTFTNPLFLLTLRQQDGTTSVLANPRIRVKNKEKAKIHIGDRVPVITTTAAAAGSFVSESVSYLDVGLKLEVEPLVYLEDDVGIKVLLEVSNIVREVRGGAGSNTLTYQIGTRNASTTLRLRDGETQILAGLISDEDRRTASRVPGLGDLPVAGRLFSANRDSTTKTEIVLLITPRLVRTLARPDAGSVEFAAGTEASTGAPGPGGPPAYAPPAPAPAPQLPATQPAPAAPLQSPTAPVVPFGGMTPPGQ